MIRLFTIAVILTFASFRAKAEDDRSLRDSLKVVSEQLAYHPDSIDLRLKKAAFNLQLKQWSYAKDEYDYVLSRQPDNIAALYYRAYVNEQIGRYNFARIDYENLLKQVPGNFEAQLGYALLNQKDKHYTDAYNQINRLVQQFPDSAVAYAARAGIEMERGMLELAEYDYEEAVKREPSNDYLVSLADVRIRLRKYSEARKVLDGMVKDGTPRAALKELYDRLVAN